MCSLHLTLPWGTVGSHSAEPRDQLQILSQYLGQEYWLAIDPTYMFLIVVETGAPKGNPREYEENMQTPR